MFTPQEIGSRIAARRKELKLSQKEVAARVQLNPSTIMRYEKGQFSSPKPLALCAIASALDLTPVQLCGEELLPAPQLSPYQPSGVMPILGRVSAGLPILAAENIEGYTACDYRDGENYFSLRVSGDSMNAAGIGDGDLVVVRQQSAVDQGEIAVVLVNGDDATVKRFYSSGDTVTLMPQSNNPIHQIQVYDPRQIPIRVIGRVMEVRKRF